jgi:hypothetical protein
MDGNEGFEGFLPKSLRTKLDFVFAFSIVYNISSSEVYVHIHRGVKRGLNENTFWGN